MAHELKTKSSAQQAGRPMVDNRDAQSVPTPKENLNVEVSANLCELRVGPEELEGDYGGSGKGDVGGCYSLPEKAQIFV